MATLTSNGSVIVVSAFSKLHVFAQHDEAPILGKLIRTVDVTSVSNDLPIIRTAREDEDSKKSQTQEKIEVYCTAFSRDGTLFAAATSAKTCIIYNSDGCTVVRAFRIPKAPTSITFDSNGSHVVIGDRQGNVTQYGTHSQLDNHCRLDINGEETNHEGVPLTGGITMIIDVKLSEDGKLLITGDRDEKIRISRYPQSFVVQSFALDHSSYVGTVSVIGDSVYSSGGDATIRQFLLDNGKQLAVSEKLHDTQPVRKVLAYRKDSSISLLACIDKHPELLSLSVNGEQISISKRLSLTSPIMDFVVLSNDQVLVVTSDGLSLVNVSSSEVTLLQLDDSELEASLKEVKDPMPSYYKNVTHQNMVEYQERKTKKMEKIAEKKASKRKAEDANIGDIKKQEVDTAV